MRQDAAEGVPAMEFMLMMQAWSHLSGHRLQAMMAHEACSCMPQAQLRLRVPLRPGHQAANRGPGGAQRVSRTVALSEACPHLLHLLRTNAIALSSGAHSDIPRRCAGTNDAKLSSSRSQLHFAAVHVS